MQSHSIYFSEHTLLKCLQTISQLDLRPSLRGSLQHFFSKKSHVSTFTKYQFFFAHGKSYPGVLVRSSSINLRYVHANDIGFTIPQFAFISRKNWRFQMTTSCFSLTLNNSLLNVLLEKEGLYQNIICSESLALAETFRTIFDKLWSLVLLDK